MSSPASVLEAEPAERRDFRAAAAPPADDFAFPFVPHPGVRGGHSQTLVAYFRNTAAEPRCTMRHVVSLPDGDRLVLHENRPLVAPPSGVRPRTLLLLHGLAGAARSAYMRRIAGKAAARGHHTFRLDFRTAGAGRGMAKRPYHAGRSADLLSTLGYLEELLPAVAVDVVGFSLGGNVGLKAAGEVAELPPPNWRRLAVVCPPIDLRLSVRSLVGPIKSRYDRFFTKLLIADIHDWWSRVPNAPRVALSPKPRSVLDLDEAVTAPLSGFKNADDYYAKSSALPLLQRIAVPTLFLHAADDPMVPVAPVLTARLSPAIKLEITPSGGHMGYLARPTPGFDGRWMDARLLAWLEGG